MSTVKATQRFVTLIPAKGLTGAKRRLEVDPKQRRALAMCFLADAVAAASRAQLVKEVVVLTPDPSLGGLAGSLGATWLPDQAVGGLNAAVRDGVRRLRHPVGHVAVMVADLPALDASELDTALGQLLDSDSGRLCVEDRSGGGTTLLAAREARALVPQFGEDSAARHHEAGFSLATGALLGLRLDVDTLDDLRRAAALRSFGPVTARALSDLRLFERVNRVDGRHSISFPRRGSILAARGRHPSDDAHVRSEEVPVGADYLRP
ncbi:2-phospho-L-lactate guanylyltransferase [Nocardioides taihuensis]|uniref:Phosphoenolpyruvate guanylyltransferase n=1 Tax=Nocardioides taihuensis TaxID=1835606 RepID=A0ABW0BKX6_9ACTN